jgi:phenylalanine-4-hydroxylase
MFTLADRPGALQQALNIFAAHEINMSRLETKPCLHSSNYEFHVDFDGLPSQPAVQALLAELRASAQQVNILESKKVAWFPRHKRDLDVIANDILAAGTDLDSDHPGFSDPVYRARRAEQTQLALDFRYGDKIPRIAYTPEEVACWGEVYGRLRTMHEEHACAEHMRLLPLFEQNCGYSKDNIPQLQDISDFLAECTGFTIRPVAGLLSTRNFLYGLAFRTFFSTQYLRHHSKPLYTPEPDLVHEIMGHVPLFADQDFADFSQEIGLAAIGATDEQIEELGRCYWFSVEFGLCKQQGQLKAYGAGLLSSFGELKYSLGLSDDAKPEYRPFDPFNASKQTYPITTYQPLYYVAESFQDAKSQMKTFSRSLARAFNVRYNPYTATLDIDANVRLEDHVAQGKVDVYAQDKAANTGTPSTGYSATA